jgi:hypothetical protein
MLHNPHLVGCLSKLWSMVDPIMIMRGAECLWSRSGTKKSETSWKYVAKASNCCSLHIVDGRKLIGQAWSDAALPRFVQTYSMWTSSCQIFQPKGFRKYHVCRRKTYQVFVIIDKESIQLVVANRIHQGKLLLETVTLWKLYWWMQYAIL